MPSANVGALLEALNQRDVTSSLLDEIATHTDLWVATIRKQRDWHSKAMRMSGVQSLVTVCESEGEGFDRRWVAKKRAQMALRDCGGDREVVNDMPIAKFAAAICKAAPMEKSPRPQGRNSATKVKLSKRQRLASLRRKEVARLSKKGIGPGEITTKLFELRSVGKLDKDTPISAIIVRQDLQPDRNVTK